MRPRVAIFERIHGDGIAQMGRFASVDVQVGLSRQQTLRAVGNYEAIVIKSETLVDRALLDAAPRLRAVGRAGVGTENIDREYAASKGVRVLTVPAGNADSAAEFTVASILALLRRLPEARDAVMRGDYRRHLLEGRELARMTVGIVGLGDVGLRVAKCLSGFGCRMVAVDPKPQDVGRLRAMGVTLLPSFDALLREADILTLHVKQTPQTEGMLDARALARAKPGVYIVNTSRGAVIDEAALLAALNSRHVAGAALDVLTQEPPFDAEPGTAQFDSPLLHHPAVIFTPHIGASTVDAQRHIALDIANQLRAVLEPVANPETHLQ